MKVRVQNLGGFFDLISFDKYGNVDVKLSPYIRIKALVVTENRRRKDRSNIAFYNNSVRLAKW